MVSSFVSVLALFAAFNPTLVLGDDSSSSTLRRLRRNILAIPDQAEQPSSHENPFSSSEVDVQALWERMLFGDSSFSSMPMTCSTVPKVDGSFVPAGEPIEGEFPIEGSSAQCNSVAISDNGQRIAVQVPVPQGPGPSQDCKVQVWEYKNAIKDFEQLGSDIVGEVIPFNTGFGDALSLSETGNIVAVGAPDYRGPGVNDFNGGIVKILEYNGTDWNDIGEALVGDAESDRFGFAVSLSDDGTIVAVGSPRARPSGMINEGLVRAYRFDGTNYVPFGNDIVGEQVGTFQGTFVSLSGNGRRVAVGGSDILPRAAQVFESDPDSEDEWNLIGKFEATTLEEAVRSLALSNDGTHLAVGRSSMDGECGSASGRIHVYKYTEQPGMWENVGDPIEGEKPEINLGRDVAISSSGLEVAASANNGVLVFEFDGIVWKQRGDRIKLEFPVVALSGTAERVATGVFSRLPEGGLGGISKYQVFNWAPGM